MTQFVGRQPIFDRTRKVYGYELLFRSGGANAYDAGDGDLATARVLSNTLNVIGFHTLVGSGNAFINFTRRTLLAGDYKLLPARTTVVELLETVEPTADIVAACRAVKEAGYALALDDFVYKPGYDPLIELADIIKVDFILSPPAERAALAGRFGDGRIQLLAEKVETYADFQAAMDLGYTLAQGYFFCKPEVLSGREMPAFKRLYLLFLAEVNRPDVDFTKLERIVKQEVSLSIKLLRYLNSAAVGMPQHIDSIRQALTLLGERPLRKWASLVALTCMAEDKPVELKRTTLVRARFCELLACPAGFANRELDLFLMGLLSTMDAVLDRPVDEVLLEVPVPVDVKTALLGARTRLGNVLGLVKALETGDQDRFSELIARFGLSPEQVAAAYAQAIGWTEEIFRQ